jgi:hypothetical protein
MKTNLILVLAALAAGATGYWAGCFRTRQTWEHASEVTVHQGQHYANWTRAAVGTKVLKYLAEGKQVEARAVLEGQLDAALIGLVAYEKTYCPDGRDSIGLGVVREARGYRSEHPWSPEENQAARLQEAFKWAD